MLRSGLNQRRVYLIESVEEWAPPKKIIYLGFGRNAEEEEI